MFFFICTSYGQEPGCDPGCNCRADGSVCPIDGGLTTLLAIGVAYGIKKYRSNKKHSEDLDGLIVE
jgi:hypothetical protein